jgi:hypothetical protein
MAIEMACNGGACSFVVAANFAWRNHS